MEIGRAWRHNRRRSKIVCSIIWYQDLRGSTEFVASSMTITLFFFKKTLPRQKSCLCPTLQFPPFSTTITVTGMNKAKTGHATSDMIVTVPNICTKENAHQLSFFAISKSTTLWSEEACSGKRGGH